MTYVLQGRKCALKMETVAGTVLCVPTRAALRTAADSFLQTNAFLCPVSASGSPPAAEMCWLCLGGRQEVLGCYCPRSNLQRGHGRWWAVVKCVLQSYGLLVCTLLALVFSLGHFCSPLPCFLGSPPKSTLCTQILVSGSAFLGTHTDPETKRDLRDISATHLCLKLPGAYLDPDSIQLKKNN